MFSCSGTLKPEPPKTVKDPGMVALYKKAISGDVKSLRAISEQYRNGTNGFPRNARQAANALYMAANAGDTQSQLDLARCYEDGYGRLTNRRTAMGWYYKAGQQGSKLGKQKYEEIGTQLAEEEAEREREREREQRRAKGEVVWSDEEAVNYFIHGVEQAHDSLAFSNVMSYTLPDQRPLIYNECSKWVMSGNDYADSRYILGLLTFQGWGCTANRALGIQYLRQAAAVGHRGAQQALYEAGLRYGIR